MVKMLPFTTRKRLSWDEQEHPYTIMTEYSIVYDKDMDVMRQTNAGTFKTFQSGVFKTEEMHHKASIYVSFNYRNVLSCS